MVLRGPYLVASRTKDQKLPLKKVKFGKGVGCWTSLRFREECIAKGLIVRHDLFRLGTLSPCHQTHEKLHTGS